MASNVKSLSDEQVASHRRRLATAACCAAILAAAVLAYFNSFRGEFVYDDHYIILERVKQFWPPWPVLGNATAVPDLTFALNYRFGGLDTWGFHAVNLLVHVLAALTLFGLVRRTLATPRLAETFGRAAAPLALVIAVLWAVHPLQTESVTYIVQRQTAMMGLFYLLTMYCLLRGATSSRRAAAWYVATALACALGMRSKQVMVTAPVLALLFDRTFLAGTFKKALRLRWPLYIALAATWGLLYTSTQRVKTSEVTFTVERITSWDYFRTQLGVIAHYLQLSVYPQGQCLEYLWPIARRLSDVWPQAIILGALGALTLWALVKKPAAGFVGAWFFAILAPTSSFITMTYPAFEHRMYLSLAGVAAATVLGTFLLGRRLLGRDAPSQKVKAAATVGGIACVAAVVAMTVLTTERNRVYYREQDIWQDVLQRYPTSARAYYNMAAAYTRDKEPAAAIPLYRKAVQYAPDYCDAYNNLALSLSDVGQTQEAMSLARKAVVISPKESLAQSHYNLGVILGRTGELDAAAEEYRKALAIENDYPEACNNLGDVRFRQGRLDEAVAEYLKAVELDGRYVLARNNLARAYAQEGNLPAAENQLREALAVNSRNAMTHFNLGVILAMKGDKAGAIEHCEEALRLDPDFSTARAYLRELTRQTP
jgi:Flp pilus assembly protein TadD